MEPGRGWLGSIWKSIVFLPIFAGLLILGLIKGILMLPVISVVITMGISAIILGLWPLHCFYTYYCILSAKKFGPVLKMVLCICTFVVLLSWPPIGISCSIVFGLAYGILSPMFATFKAVEEGRSDKFYHCICDGTYGSVQESFTIIRDFLDVCYHSYLSIMNDLRHQGPDQETYYEIRLLYLLPSLIVGALGVIVDLPVITIIALCKSPVMLVKGWIRLFHDCVGCEGPFLETICVPFAGLAVLLWPLAVVGAVLGSILSSIILGAYAAVVAYKESSIWFGLCYIVASLSIYDEYSNDVLDMPEGSCFPRPQYSKNPPSRSLSPQDSLKKPGSVKNPPSRSNSLAAPMVELRALDLADSLFKGCRRYGEALAEAGIINRKDIEDAKNKDSGNVITLGLPAYCLLQTLLYSAKANSTGILISDDGTEITSSNRPKDKFFDWFLIPLLIIKEQLKAHALSEPEELYLGVLVLLSGDPIRLKNSNIAVEPESELRRAELDALARRLRGIMKSISRYPTFRRRFESTMKNIFEELTEKSGSSRKNRTTSSSKNMVARLFSQKHNHASDEEAQSSFERDMEIQ